MQDLKDKNQDRNLEKSFNRDARIEIRVTKEEMERLKFLSKDFRNVSDYLRHCSLSDKDRKFRMTDEVKKAFQELKKEVNSIGVNVNQIARYINFLEDNGIVHAPAIERFNNLIIKYTTLQLRIEGRLKQFFKH